MKYQIYKGKSPLIEGPKFILMTNFGVVLAMGSDDDDDEGLATVDVLLTGYVIEGEGERENFPAFLEGHGALFVQPTVSLVRDGDIRLIVDPGIMSDEVVEDLRRALKKSHKLKFDDITDIFVTHQHIDHTKNIGIFENARVYDFASTYEGDRWERHLGEFEISPNIRIIQTPGHTFEDASLVVETKEGVVVLTDVWWFPDRTPDQDPLAEDQALLDASRLVVLELADRVVTSHGGSFDVD